MRCNLLKKLLVLPFVASLSLMAQCDTERDKDPYIVINVNYSGTVDENHKLYVVFYAMPNRTIPFFRYPSSSTEILVPQLNTGDTAFYFDIVHDINGDGIGSGDLFQGWNGITGMTGTEILTPVVLPATDMVVLNVDLDNYGVIP